MTLAQWNRVAVTLLAFACLAAPGKRSWGAELVRLDANTLRSRVAESQSYGIVPGDVLLTNSFMKVVLKATIDKTPQAVGGAILWQGLPASAIQLRPGAQITWNSADAGSNGQVAVVRYQHVSSDWQAELVYKLYENRPWLEVSLTVHNRNQSQRLEFPLLMEMMVPTDSEVDHKSSPVWVTTKQNGTTAALFRPEGKLAVAKETDTRWWFEMTSGDPEASVMKRVSRRLPLIRRFSSDSPIRPLDSTKDWPRSFRDHTGWHRIEPGQSRTVECRIVLGAGDEHAKSLLEYAKSGTAPSIKLVPTNTRADVPGMTPSPGPSVASPPKVIVGERRTNSGGSPPPVFLPPKTSTTGTGATPSVGPMLSPPPQRQEEPGPLLLPSSVNDVPDLPLPLD